MTIVDTAVWVDYLRGTDTLNTIWLDAELMHVPIGLTDLILCEVLQGTPAVQVDKVQRQMRMYHLFETGGEMLAVAAAQNYRFLRARGITIRKTIDCLIATFCIAEGHTLLHNDRDFDPFEEHLGLQVLHPSRH